MPGHFPLHANWGRSVLAGCAHHDFVSTEKNGCPRRIKIRVDRCRQNSESLTSHPFRQAPQGVSFVFGRTSTRKPEGDKSPSVDFPNLYGFILWLGNRTLFDRGRHHKGHGGFCTCPRHDDRGRHGDLLLSIISTRDEAEEPVKAPIRSAHVHRRFSHRQRRVVPDLEITSGTNDSIGSGFISGPADLATHQNKSQSDDHDQNRHNELPHRSTLNSFRTTC